MDPSNKKSTPKGALAERFMLMSHQQIVQACGEVNELTKGEMDVRPVIHEDHIKSLKSDAAALFSFFEQKRFLEEGAAADSKSSSKRKVKSSSKRKAKSQSKWKVNSKLDDEWALNMFSEDIDLLATGVSKFDDVLKGGFRVYHDKVASSTFDTKCVEPFVLTLQGRPGSGKTTIALQILCNFAAQGYSTLYLSVEQDLHSLRRTIERFCSTTGWDQDRDATAVKCTLAETPASDRQKFASNLAAWVKTKSEGESAHTIFSSVSTELTKALSESDPVHQSKSKSKNDPPTLEDVAKNYKAPDQKKEFFVAIIRRDTDGQLVLEKETAEKVRQWIIDGLHGVVLSAVDESSVGKREAGRSQDGGKYVRLDAAALVETLKHYRSRPKDPDIPNDPYGEGDGFGLVFSWLAVDSITALTEFGTRKSLSEFKIAAAKEKLPTALVLLTECTSDSPSTPTDLEIASDKVIEIGERPLEIAAETGAGGARYMQRYLEVKKCRLAPFHRGQHPIAIKTSSVKAYRSITILLKVTGKRRRSSNWENSERRGEEAVIFGIEGLDGKVGLADSIKKGSVTVLTGPPGSKKTGISTYFCAKYIYDQYQALKKENDGEPVDETKLPKTIVYSFGGDRRGVVHGMNQYITPRGERLIGKDSAGEASPVRDCVRVRDISPGYLFPEQFVETLIDTLDKKQGDRIERIVFDSFDSVHAAFPIMRMDQFLWKVIFQVCWDYGVSALLKVSELEHASEYYHNMASLVTSMADNILHVDKNDNLNVIETETGGHTRSKLRLETEYWHCENKLVGMEEHTEYAENETARFPTPDDGEPGMVLRIRRDPPSLM